MNTDIVLFGASNLGKATFILLKNSYNIVWFCDNDPEKWGKSIEGIKIIPPSK
jgi:NADH/NAD ratio-sensing transcriptional regulator Rex